MLVWALRLRSRKDERIDVQGDLSTLVDELEAVEIPSPLDGLTDEELAQLCVHVAPKGCNLDYDVLLCALRERE